MRKNDCIEVKLNILNKNKEICLNIPKDENFILVSSNNYNDENLSII